MQLPSLQIIESWPKANYENPTTGGLYNLVIPIVLFPIVYIMVILRFYTRIRITKNFGLDDWLILMSTVCSPIILTQLAILIYIK